jgi:hypothetical protein
MDEGGEMKDTILKAFAEKDKRIAELEAQVENMKCCGNCGYWKRIGCRGVEPEHCCRNWKPG